MTDKGRFFVDYPVEVLAEPGAESLDRHKAPPPHEQWMHAGKTKGLAKNVVKAAVKAAVKQVSAGGLALEPKTATVAPNLPSKVTGWNVSQLLPLFSVGEVVGTWKAKNGNKVVAEYRLVKTAQGKGPSAVSISVKHSGTGGDFVPAEMTNEEKSSFVVGKVWAINGGGSTAKDGTPQPIPPPAAVAPSPTATHADGIGHIPDKRQAEIFAAYKSQPKGQLLASPASDSFDNLVAVAHVFSQDLPGGLTAKQVAQIVDRQLAHAQKLGNQSLLEKKISDWLQTGTGAGYARQNGAPKQGIVGSLTGDLVLPEGVALKPGQKVQKVAGPGGFKPGQKFTEHTAKQAQTLQDAHKAANGIPAKYTTDQYAALKNYTGGGYTGMNNYLRGKTNGNSLIKQQVVDVQAAMMPIQENTVLLRGAGWEQLPEGFRDLASAKTLVGKTFEEPGFTSTSVAGSGGNFSGSVHLIIEAPAGTPAVFVKDLSLHKSENEMLLAAGTKFRVMSVDQTSPIGFGSYQSAVIRLRVVTPK